MRHVVMILGLAGFLLGPPAPAAACTSFLLEGPRGVCFAHSLNQGSLPRVDGSVYLNPRHLWKQGFRFEVLFSPQPGGRPDLVWQAAFGSVTFSPLGRDLPDGGMNEAGLFIWEMGYDAEYSTDEGLPRLFQTQWMQYQLDNFATVPEVLAAADRIALDGWGWHYFVADRQGRAAIIDHVDGQVRIHTGASLPVPLCGNADYDLALDFLAQHRGFGGDLPVVQDFAEIPRFIHGASLWQGFADQDPVDYSFAMLAEMSCNVRWSVVFDPTAMTCWFTTNLDAGRRRFQFSAADFDPALGVRVLDINTPGPADVKDRFAPLDPRRETAQLAAVLGYFLESGVDPGQAAALAVQRLESRPEGGGGALAGEWSGLITPESDGPRTALAARLVVAPGQGGQAGLLTGGGRPRPLTLHNLRRRGGLVSFTARDAETGELLLFQLHEDGSTLAGRVCTWDWDNRTTALVEFSR